MFFNHMLRSDFISIKSGNHSCKHTSDQSDILVNTPLSNLIAIRFQATASLMRVKFIYSKSVKSTYHTDLEFLMC